MKEPKFRGYSLETRSWHTGYGWFEVDYTEEYKQQKGIDDKACLYTDSFPMECELRSMGATTTLKDKNDKEIFGGDVIKIPCDINDEFHGGFTLHEVLFRNGIWIHLYLTSEKGDILPKGYTGGELLSHFIHDMKTLIFSEDAAEDTEIEVVDTVFEMERKNND